MTDPKEASNANFEYVEGEDESSLLSEEEFTEFQSEEDWFEFLRLSLEDIDAGRTIPADEALRMFRAGLGIDDDAAK